VVERVEVEETNNLMNEGIHLFADAPSPDWKIEDARSLFQVRLKRGREGSMENFQSSDCHLKIFTFVYVFFS